MKQDQATNHNHAELTGPHEPRGTIDELPDEKSRPGSPQAVPAYSRAVELERVPVKLNRNFLNFPLARDTRAQANWAQDSTTGRWSADLPGEGRKSHLIRLILRDKNEEWRHCPSALDMNVLFQLLAEAQRTNATTRVEFASLSDLLRRLGLEERDRERKRVVSSIAYWSVLSIEWQRWYVPRRRHVVHTMPPPVEDGGRDGHRLWIRLNPAWYRLAQAQGYHLWLPLPLPPQAAAQNLALLISTQRSAEEDGDVVEPHPDDSRLTQPMDRWWLARHLGMLHKQRNRVLDRAVDQAAQWFSAHGGELKLVAAPDGDERRIAFRSIKPRAPQRKSSMGRSRGPLHSSGRKSSRPSWPAIPDENYARMADIKYDNDEQEYFEADQHNAGLEQYFAMVRLKAGKVAGGR